MIDEVELLCDRLENLADDALLFLSSPMLVDKQKQLRHVKEAIEQLEKASVPVPHELINLADCLTRDLVDNGIAKDAVALMFSRLNGILARLRPCVKPDTAEAKGRPSVTPVHTPASVFVPAIQEVLVDMGGSGKVEEVLERVLAKMKPNLVPGDFDIDEQSGEITWMRWAKHAGLRMSGALGLLRRDSQPGFWQLIEL